MEGGSFLNRFIFLRDIFCQPFLAKFHQLFLSISKESTA
jgi:hypothetical protein